MNTHSTRFPRTDTRVVVALSFQSQKPGGRSSEPPAKVASRPLPFPVARPPGLEALSAGEASALDRCETTIRKGLKTFVEVGAALMEIRDRALYRATHKTWEEYCRGTWGFTARYATYQIESSAVVKELKASQALLPERAGQSPLPNGQHGKPEPVVPETESQARPLTRLPVDERPKAWESAVRVADLRGYDKPTAKMVEQVVKERLAKRDAAPGPSTQLKPSKHALPGEIKLAEFSVNDALIDLRGATGYLKPLVEKFSLSQEMYHADKAADHLSCLHNLLKSGGMFKNGYLARNLWPRARGRRKSARDPGAARRNDAAPGVGQTKAKACWA